MSPPLFFSATETSEMNSFYRMPLSESSLHKIINVTAESSLLSDLKLFCVKNGVMDQVLDWKWKTSFFLRHETNWMTLGHLIFLGPRLERLKQSQKKVMPNHFCSVVLKTAWNCPSNEHGCLSQRKRGKCRLQKSKPFPLLLVSVHTQQNIDRDALSSPAPSVSNKRLPCILSGL